MFGSTWVGAWVCRRSGTRWLQRVTAMKVDKPRGPRLKKPAPQLRAFQGILLWALTLYDYGSVVVAILAILGGISGIPLLASIGTKLSVVRASGV